MKKTKCDKCKLGMKNNCYKSATRCYECEQYAGEMHCRCDDVEDIENCPYFKPLKENDNAE